MTALRRHLDAWHIKSQSAPELLAQADRTLALAEALDRNIDLITLGLRPASLDDLGLAAALRDLLVEWSRRTAIVGELDVLGHAERRLPRDVEEHLYRLVQEALQNVARHSDATHVAVILKRRDTETVVIVEDNGCGFDPAAAAGSGVGLVSMRERAMLFGGSLVVESTRGTGTTVIARIP